MKKEVYYLIFSMVAVFLFYFFGPGCPQQALFGISCLGCGMTRAYIQLLHGNIKGAFFYHPAFWTVPIAVPVFFFRNKIRKEIVYVIVGLIFLIFLSAYLYRFYTHDPVLIFDIKKGLLYKIWKALQKRLLL